MIEKNWWLVAVLFFTLLGSSLGLAQAPAGSGEAKPLALSALKLSRETVTTYQELPGRTAAYEIAEIRPQVSGIITARMFEEGSDVKAGAQLYQIDPASYQAAYTSALADLQKAEATVVPLASKFKRLGELVAIHAISEQEYDDLKAALAEAQAGIAIAKAAVDRAKINLDYTKVYAPISGRIGKSILTKGSLVSTNQAQALAVITRVDPIYVDISQSSNDLMRLRRGLASLENLPVSLVLEDESSPYTAKGKLLFHEMAVDPSTGMVKLRARFPNPDSYLLPGLFVRARIELTYPNALLLPQRAAQRGPDGKLTTWILDSDNSARQVPVTVVRAVGSSWLVKDGLESGDRVLLNGQINLRPGVRVNPIMVERSELEAKQGGE